MNSDPVEKLASSEATNSTRRVISSGSAGSAWHVDGRTVGFLYVREGSVPARIDRIEIESGRRTRWKTLGPRDSTGVGHVWSVRLTPDGEGYAYTHGLFLQDLFLADGLP